MVNLCLQPTTENLFATKVTHLSILQCHQKNLTYVDYASDTDSSWRGRRMRMLSHCLSAGDTNKQAKQAMPLFFPTRTLPGHLSAWTHAMVMICSGLSRLLLSSLSFSSLPVPRKLQWVFPPDSAVSLLQATFLEPLPPQHCPLLINSPQPQP